MWGWVENNGEGEGGGNLVFTTPAREFGIKSSLSPSLPVCGWGWGWGGRKKAGVQSVLAGKSCRLETFLPRQ